MKRTLTVTINQDWRAFLAARLLAAARKARQS